MQIPWVRACGARRRDGPAPPALRSLRSLRPSLAAGGRAEQLADSPAAGHPRSRRAPPAMLTLYTTLLSANGRKPAAVAHHLDLKLDVRSVNVYAGEGRAPEYLRVNPFGKIPSLV